MKISHDDERLLHRFLDGELAAAEAAAFRTRIDSEPLLRQRADEERAIRGGFAAARGAGPVAPAGFAASVMDAVRRLPSRRELEQADVGEAVIRLCKRVLVAALLVFAVGAAWHVGLFETRHDNVIEAAPDEIRSELDRLDKLIEAEARDASRGSRPR